ncbi:hypothetical protein ACFDAA_18235 [Enterococcus casseliflavus]|uniref:hypothetical protein n=1 Tax=Enterococcus casseliflavus TaxID=37734 RepID=UPI0039A4D2BC
MRDFYSFKLNLTHPILDQYKSEEKKSNLFESVIPQYLDKVLGEAEVIGEYRKYTINHVTENLFPTDILQKKYKKLLEKTQQMYVMYEELIKNFEKTGNILYPAEYIQLNEECKKERYSLETKVEELESVYEDVRDYEVSDKIKINRSLGIGVSHFFKMEKIRTHLSVVNIEFECFYEPKKECFYFAKENTSKKRADFVRIKNQANVLMELLNNDPLFKKKLGNVTIIEQYQRIKLSETTTKVSIELVYPNASAENEITSELSDISREIGAETLKIDAAGDKLNISKLDKLLTREGLSGYVSNVSSKGKDLVLKITSLFL